nr:MAG TPA: hypothetical protein [Caudoviricetes sp.]
MRPYRHHTHTKTIEMFLNQDNIIIFAVWI